MLTLIFICLVYRKLFCKRNSLFAWIFALRSPSSIHALCDLIDNQSLAMNLTLSGSGERIK